MRSAARPRETSARRSAQPTQLAGSTAAASATRRRSARQNESTGCISSASFPSSRLSASIRSSPRIVPPACREAQVANVHQLAPPERRSATAAASRE